MQIFKHGIDKFSAAPLGIEVLISQNEAARILSSTLRRNPECTSVSNMEQTRGRRR